MSASDDARMGLVLAELLARSHLMAPGALDEHLAEYARPLGVLGARIYLADLEQVLLNPIPAGTGERPPGLVIDSSTAGRAFRTVAVHHLDLGDGRHRVWVPLIDGTERLGVLELVVDGMGEATLDRCRTLASLTGLMVVGKSAYSDVHHQVRRSREMALQAEMVWAFVAPTTFATEQVLITATLEPAYEVGGDAFDYSLTADHMNVSVFDSVGHDLAAGLVTSVAMASCRTTRRSRGDLTTAAVRADHAINSQFGGTRYATAVLADLDIATGRLSWINCGHPPPLLLRGNKVIKELAHRPFLPLGLADVQDPDQHITPPVYHEQLQPGDRVLLYTDGVIEGRAADGHAFGLRRLTDFIIRHSSTGTPAPETLRRLNKAVVDYQHGRLSDDATTVLLEWQPDNPGRRLTPQREVPALPRSDGGRQSGGEASV